MAAPDPPVHSGASKKRVLFMPEGCILAHVGRTLAVAQRMDLARFDVCFAASGDNAFWLEKAG